MNPYNVMFGMGFLLGLVFGSIGMAVWIGIILKKGNKEDKKK